MESQGKKGQVQSQLDTLSVATKELDDTIERIAIRLNEVLRPSIPTNKTDPEANISEEIVPLANTIRDCVQSSMRQRERLLDILDRLEL